MRLSRRVLQIMGQVAGALVLALVLVLAGYWGTAEAQSGGSIAISVRAGGQDAKAQVVVKTATAEPEQVAKGRSGTPIPVPSGTYDVTITCTDLVDHPTQELRGLVVSGDAIEREATFPSGTITLHVKRGGRVLRNATLHFIKVGGDTLPGTAKTGVPFRASPGQYEAEIIIGRGRSKMSHSITGIQVYDGAKRSLPVSL